MSDRMRPIGCLALAVALVLAGARFAFAQSGRGGAPDVVDLALAWARGAYGSPIVCRLGSKVERGLRHVVIAPGPRTSEQRVDKLSFVDLDAKGVDRCDNELGEDEPNVIGTLFITYVTKRPRSDTPDRDLEQDLKSGPLEFEVVSGRLRIGLAGAAPESLHEVDFSRGKAHLGKVAPGSDDARRLGDFSGQRRLSLVLETHDGTRLAMPLVEFERR